MSDIFHNESAESPGSSLYGGPTSPTLVNMPLEEFPPTQPGIFTSCPRQPRLLTPAPHAPIPAGPATIINGLVVTSEARTHRFNQDLATQEVEHKKKLDDCEETIEFLEAHLVGYIDTFSQPPEGYVENGHLTTFTIPCGGGLSNPAKWVKKLDDGRVAGYTAEDGPHNLPHVCEIYASPKYTADPAEPLPHWIHETLQGPRRTRPGLQGPAQSHSRRAQKHHHRPRSMPWPTRVRASCRTGFASGRRAAAHAHQHPGSQGMEGGMRT